MASDLYEVLGISKTASPEDVRKAYKKKALATHPDRLPPNVSEDERQAANERFRLVNNAYEVLNDAGNRKLYDQHGVWPPPTAAEGPPAASASFAHDPYGSPFRGGPFFERRHPMHGFAFTDPFELFNSLFGDFHRAFHQDPFRNEFPIPHSPFDLMFGSSPHRSRSEDFFGRSALSPFGFGAPFGGERPLFDAMIGGMGGSMPHRSVSHSMGTGGQWVSESTMIRTINGRTEKIVKRRDVQGNEHITYSSPEGERHTVNGIEQSRHDSRYLSQPESHPSATSPPPILPSGSSRPDRSQAQDIPINFLSSSPVRPTAPSQPEPPRGVQPTYRHRHHSTHDPSRVRVDDDGVRRSSSSRMYAERERGESHLGPGQYYDTSGPRQSTSSRHSHHSHHSHERVPHSESPRQDNRATYSSSNLHQPQSSPCVDPMPQDPSTTHSAERLDRRGSNVYADPLPHSAYTRSLHSRHSIDRDDRRRHGDHERRDEHHRRKWWNGSHGW